MGGGRFLQDECDHPYGVLPPTLVGSVWVFGKFVVARPERRCRPVSFDAATQRQDKVAVTIVEKLPVNFLRARLFQCTAEVVGGAGIRVSVGKEGGTSIVVGNILSNIENLEWKWR